MTALPPSKLYPRLAEFSAPAFTDYGAGSLPGLVGLEVLELEPAKVVGRMPIRPELMNPNGQVHGASPVILADTLCGYGCMANLPPGATGFTTIELKINLVGAARGAALRCEAVPVHAGRTTQLWDATVTDEESGRLIATFRCTQLVLQR